MRGNTLVTFSKVFCLRESTEESSTCEWCLVPRPLMMSTGSVSHKDTLLTNCTPSLPLSLPVHFPLSTTTTLLYTHRHTRAYSASTKPHVLYTTAILYQYYHVYVYVYILLLVLLILVLYILLQVSLLLYYTTTHISTALLYCVMTLLLFSFSWVCPE